MHPALRLHQARGKRSFLASLATLSAAQCLPSVNHFPERRKHGRAAFRLSAVCLAYSRYVFPMSYTSSPDTASGAKNPAQLTNSRASRPSLSPARPAVTYQQHGWRPDYDHGWRGRRTSGLLAGADWAGGRSGRGIGLAQVWRHGLGGRPGRLLPRRLAALNRSSQERQFKPRNTPNTRKTNGLPKGHVAPVGWTPWLHHIS